MAPTPPPARSAASPDKVLASMMLALALVVAAVSSLNLALPEIARSTGATQTELQWIVDAYAIVFAGLLLPAGALGDRIGRRKVLVAGLVVFAVANLYGALDDEPASLIVARGIAGVGAALIMPATLSIVTTVFRPEERSRAVGTWAGVAGGGAIVGLLVSGALLEVTAWQWVLVVNVVWAVAALVAAARWAPDSRATEHVALDPVGAALSAGGLGAVVFATIEGPHRGWTDGLVVGGYVLGALALLGFVAWELTRRHPLLDPRLFRDGMFTLGAVSITVQFVAFFGFVFVGLQYLQLVLGYSPLQAALATVPLAVTIGGLSRQVTPRLLRHVDPGVLNATGLATMAPGFALFATLDRTDSYWSVLASLTLLGIGAGLAMTPATTAIVESLPESKQGVASAVNDTAREVGGAIGIAVLGSLAISGYRTELDPHLAGAPPEVADRARHSLAAVVHAADRSPVAAELVTPARDAFAAGMSNAMWAGAAIVTAGAALSLVLRRARHRPTTPSAPSHPSGPSGPARGEPAADATTARH